MNEARLNYARLHISWEEIQRRLARCLAMNEAELNAARLHIECEEIKRR